MNIETRPSSATEQFLTFRLGEEEFGVEIRRVQGIQGWNKATQIPQTPAHVLGVIDLRGTVVPIIDLRRRLGFKHGGFSSTTVVIVVKVELEGDERTFGLVVDAVSEVRDVTPAERKERPDFGAGVKAEYMLGLAAAEERMVILLDLDKLMSDTDFPIELDGDEAIEAAPEDTGGALDVEALETSFALLAPRAEELVGRFYDSLFERHPAVQPMFANSDMPAQKRKLLAALKLVVASLRKPEALGPTLAKLGARHEQLGATAEHYGAVAETLLGVMSEMAGDAWTPRVAAAWSGALAAVAQGMLQGYSREMPASAVA